MLCLGGEGVVPFSTMKFRAEAYYYVMRNAPMTYLTLNRLHKSLMGVRETIIQNKKKLPRAKLAVKKD